MRNAAFGLMCVALWAASAIGQPPAKVPDDPVQDGKPLSRWVATLRDSDEAVRLDAVKAIGKLGPRAKGAVKPLIESLADDDQAVQVEARRSLGKIGAAAVPELQAALKSKEAKVRFGALDALAAVGKDGVPALREALKDKTLAPAAVSAVETLGADGKDAIPELIRVMQDDESYITRQGTATVLGRMGSAAKDAIPALFGEMGKEKNLDGNHYRYASALKAIGKDAVPTLRGGLKSGNLHVREDCARVLGEMGDDGKPAADDLLAALNDPEERVARTVVAALEKLKVSGASLSAEKRVKLLGSKVSDIRLYALKAFSTVEKPEREAIAPLTELASGRIPGRKDEYIGLDEPPLAMEAIGRYGTAAVAAADVLQEALKHEYPSYRLAAAVALARVKPDRLPAALDVLRAEVSSKDVRERVAALRAVGNLGRDAKPLADVVRGVAEDSNPKVREAAADALKKIGG